jgi:hypothetical protein
MPTRSDIWQRFLLQWLNPENVEHQGILKNKGPDSSIEGGVHKGLSPGIPRQGNSLPARGCSKYIEHADLKRSANIT